MPSDFPKSFDKEGLLKCARGELFGHGNAQLPEPPMLMMDRVTEISEDGGLHGKGHIIAELDINPELWFSNVTSQVIQLCRAAWAWMPYGN